MPQTSRSARHRGCAAICAHIHGLSAAALGDPCRFCALGGPADRRICDVPARQATAVAAGDRGVYRRDRRGIRRQSE